MRDELGDRMKKNYENRTRILLPRRTYTVIRVDGKAFHTYTKGCERPFDAGLIADMNATAEYLCKNIQGAVIGFVQSDEISILMTDFATHQTDAWFDGNIQKIVSIAASMATAKFNQQRLVRCNDLEMSRAFGFLSEVGENADKNIYGKVINYILSKKLAEFDARTFTIPSKTEVMNYFIWRQQDTVRNSISSVAQSLYSSKKLHGKNMSEQQDMIFEKGINWNDFDNTVKRGRFVFKEKYEITSELKDSGKVERSRWVTRGCPTFSKEPDFLNLFIPDME
jgi:tRNA(His) 5'-end guanylyltransferase